MKSNIEEIENFILLQHNKNFSERSILNWECQLKKFNNMLKKSFTKVEEHDILKFLNTTKSVNSKRFKLNTLRKFYRYLFNLTKHDELPLCLKRVELPNQKHDDIKYRERVINTNEYELLILNSGNPKERAIVETFYNFGIRKSELLSMLYKDVQYREGMTVITVRESKTRTRDVIYYGRSKHLLEWVETLFPYKNKPKHHLFFSSQDHSKSYSEHSIAAMINRITDRADITRKITPHDFRHTCITNHCKNGTPETHIKSIMGLTKSSESLSVYDHNKTKAYEEYLKNRETQTKPTYELLEEQKQSLEKQHQMRIKKLEESQQRILKLLKETLQDNNKLEDEIFNLEEELINI